MYKITIESHNVNIIKTELLNDEKIVCLVHSMFIVITNPAIYSSDDIGIYTFDYTID